MSEINEIKETETPTKEELIKRYAEIQKITEQEANEQVGADTVEEVLKNIKNKTIEKINSTRAPMNRAQRRAMKKRVGAKKYAEIMAENDNVSEVISETAKKLNYINLIQKFRELNEKKEKEKNGEITTEND